MFLKKSLIRNLCIIYLYENILLMPIIIFITSIIFGINCQKPVTFSFRNRFPTIVLGFARSSPFRLLKFTLWPERPTNDSDCDEAQLESQISSHRSIVGNAMLNLARNLIDAKTVLSVIDDRRNIAFSLSLSSLQKYNYFTFNLW